jgi:hypothetical protein
VDHHHAASSGEWSPFFVFHVDRNRLFMILKCAPWSMVLRSFWSFYARAVRNAWLTLRARRGAHLDGSPANDASAAPRPAFMPRPNRARVHARVALSFLRHAPLMLARRARARRDRQMPDAELRRWLYPREKWDARSA